MILNRIWKHVVSLLEEVLVRLYPGVYDRHAAKDMGYSRESGKS